MNDYKELLEELRAHCLCITNGDNCNNCEGLISEKAYCRLQIELHKQAADAIEQLVKERDAAVKCIEDIETYLQMGSAKYIDKTIKEWRGVTDEID